MKISELKDKKIVHICIILGIIAIILIIAGIIMLRYQVEGETNLPFELSKMIVISTAESKEIDKVDNLKWNFSINQYNDIYLQFDKNEEYKKLSIKEFTKAAGRYESNHAGIYEMCKKDYPDPQAFFDSVKRCLRPNGRLILRDVTSDNKVLVWLMNTLEMPLANICGHGDVQVPTRDVVIKCCKKAGLKVEKFEIRKGMRMHCVVRKPMGKAIGNER